MTAGNSYTYGYNSLDRLTSAVKTGTTRGWTYDANGNRLTETGASASTFTISSTNNRISSITGALPRTYTYDTAGNTLTYATITATYNNRGRMKTLKKASVTASYVYNALGQFVKQSGGPSGTVLYVYDEAGHLLGEHTSTGALVQETVWMGDTPVATLRPGTPALIYYVHADHLNTPRRVSRPSDNKLMWTWYSDAFGADLPNENPASGGIFKYNLRFPGQLYDSQAGIMQNYFRDYDPAIGRYIESDPIGLKGGINTYAYVGDGPVDAVDPQGQASIALGSLSRQPPQPAPNTSLCTYYDQVAGQSGCKYHAFAAGVCRGQSPQVNILTGFVCSLTIANLNCIRSCLVRSDQAARKSPSCQTGKCGGCTKKSCIAAYHNACFASCGISTICDGGNPPWSWFGSLINGPGGYPNDGD